jgi:periodic tryptophan protein 1
LENYDSDEGEGVGGIASLGNAKALAYYESNADDPYMTRQADEESVDEREALEVLESDNLVIAARVEDEVAHLEIYLYESEAENLYVHHDIMLPAIPLCVEWLSVPVGNAATGIPADQSQNGSFVAVGTFEPDIEIWDLDTIDCMYPNATLGQGGKEEPDGGTAKKKKKRRKAQQANDEYHVDAVLALAANRTHRTLLASASADKTVKLWDLTTTKCAKSYSFHTDKACSIAWNPNDPTVLLSGSYDRTVVAAEMRAPDAQLPRWGVESDVETVRWNPHNANYFFVTTEDGFVHYHDRRAAPVNPAASKPVWKLHAHDKSVSSFDINPSVPGYIATGSQDKEIKLWNIEGEAPRLVVSRNLDVGKVFATNFAPDDEIGFHLAVAGSKGGLQVWDTSTNASVRHVFSQRVRTDQGEGRERIVRAYGAGSDDDDSDDDDSDEDDEGEVGEEEDGWESMDADE